MVAKLRVTTHVGRDLLSSAALFRTEAAAVWEYVVNGIEYVDRGATPKVNVLVQPKDRTISIIDNGRGMSEEDLQHFFTMHGVNRDRRAGRPGRGKFGTGKSAAFGIAQGLRIDTVRNGLCNAVLLTRQDIDSSTGADIPLQWLVRNQQTDDPNGTTVTISDIFLERIDTASIIAYIERHLGAFRGSNPQVAVNNHVCEYHEPQIASTHHFTPSEKQAAILGDVVLTVKVAQAPLEAAQQGVTVTAGSGNVVGIEHAGLERRDFGNHLFGEVDVPKLEEPSPIAPYDATRNLQLNPNHPVVRVLVGFIGAKLEEVRGELVKKESERRSTAQARALERESASIAELLNRDFREHRQRLQSIQQATARPASGGVPVHGDVQPGGIGKDRFAAGVDQPGTHAPNIRTNASKEGGTAPPESGMPTDGPAGTPNAEGSDSLSATKKIGKAKQGVIQGGFSVDYRYLGVEEHRSMYDESGLSILINLDHPALAAALEKGGVADAAFRRLSYEIAFTEYSIAFGHELARDDPDMPADDLLYEIRHALNRLARSAAPLYR
ncbi:MAG: ATP-binding protein [Dehalococcoidia bacterium]